MEGGTRTYKAVGKSFVYFSKADLEKDLSESVAMCEGKVESLGKEYVRAPPRPPRAPPWPGPRGATGRPPAGRGGGGADPMRPLA